MKPILVATAAALLTGSALHASTVSKFDATSQLYANVYLRAQQNPGALTAIPATMPFEVIPGARSASDAACIIMLADGASADDIENAGLAVVSQIDNIVVAAGSVDDIIALAQTDFVDEVSFSQEAHALLDKAREGLNVDDVHKGTGLDKIYKGAGVLCGIFDSGIDPNHINFYNYDFTDTRVKRFWKYTTNSGSNVEYDSSKIEMAGTDNSNGTHGTHVLGCMAGGHNRTGSSTKYPQGSAAILKPSATGGQYIENKATTKNPYYGTAPEADIIACGGPLTDANILSGMAKMTEYAKTTGQPLVINLSVGINTGPKDGTSKVSAALSKYAEDNNCIIMVAAGNEGGNKDYITKTTGSDGTVKTFVSGSGTMSALCEVWMQDNDPANLLQIVVYNKSTNQILYTMDVKATGESCLATNNFTTAGYKHDSSFENAFTGSYVLVQASDNSATNNRRSYSISYMLKNNPASNSNGNVCVGFIAKTGAGKRIDFANQAAASGTVLTSNGVSGWENPTPDLSINDFSTGKNVISIGAWNTRVTWATMTSLIYSYQNIDAGGLTVGKVAGYSSYGKLVDGRSKPDVCSPGTGIISSINSYYNLANDERCATYTWKNRTYNWGCEQGTSMATPAAAGVVATWLQADPNLTAAKVRTILQETANKDSYVTSGDPVRWGAGKIDALAGLKRVIQERGNNGVSNIAADADGNEIIVTEIGNNVFEVFVGDASSVNAALYSISGSLAAQTSANGDTATLDAQNLAKGVYVLSVNGKPGRRVVIR